MRKNNRILKIIGIKYPCISFISNNGEYRIIDIKSYFKSIKLIKGDFGFELIEDKKLFESATIVDKAITWKSLTKKITLKSKKKMTYFFQLDPISTIEKSIMDEVLNKSINYGRSIKMLRKSLFNLSQEELGNKIGSDKQYISKVENYKTDLELKTLRKIYEVGFNKKLLIAHYDIENPISSFANSVLTISFMKWANKKKSNLELIEGIGTSTKNYLHSCNIKSTQDLAESKFIIILELMNKRRSIASHNFDTWLSQAKLINNADWISVINLQKTISNRGDKSYSKIEMLAKKDIKEEIYHI